MLLKRSNFIDCFHPEAIYLCAISQSESIPVIYSVILVNMVYMHFNTENACDSDNLWKSLFSLKKTALLPVKLSQPAPGIEPCNLQLLQMCEDLDPYPYLGLQIWGNTKLLLMSRYKISRPNDNRKPLVCYFMSQQKPSNIFFDLVP